MERVARVALPQAPVPWAADLEDGLRLPAQTDGIDETQVQLEQLIMPDVLRGPLKALIWEREKKPTAGLVFPVERGERAGKNQVRRSHARELRAALWTAGVHSPAWVRRSGGGAEAGWRCA